MKSTIIEFRSLPHADGSNSSSDGINPYSDNEQRIQYSTLLGFHRLHIQATIQVVTPPFHANGRNFTNTDNDTYRQLQQCSSTQGIVAIDRAFPVQLIPLIH